MIVAGVTHADLEKILVVVILLVLVFFAFKLGKKWRHQYADALRLRQKLQADSNALAALRAEIASTASSSSQGNTTDVRVVVGDETRHSIAGGDVRHSGSSALRSSELWVPLPVRDRLNSGSLGGKEVIDGSDYGQLSERVHGSASVHVPDDDYAVRALPRAGATGSVPDANNERE